MTLNLRSTFNLVNFSSAEHDKIMKNLTDNIPSTLKNIDQYVEKDNSCKCGLVSWYSSYMCNGCRMIRRLSNIRYPLNECKNVINYNDASYYLTKYNVTSSITVKDNIIYLDPFYNYILSNHAISEKMSTNSIIFNVPVIYPFICGDIGYCLQSYYPIYTGDVTLKLLCRQLVALLDFLQSNFDYIYHTPCVNNIYLVDYATSYSYNKKFDVSSSYSLRLRFPGNSCYSLSDKSNSNYRFCPFTCCYIDKPDTPHLKTFKVDGKPYYRIPDVYCMRNFIHSRRMGNSIYPSFDTYMFMLDLVKLNIDVVKDIEPAWRSMWLPQEYDKLMDRLNNYTGPDLWVLVVDLSLKVNVNEDLLTLLFA